MDINNSNMIDYTEFVMATINREEMIASERLETAFKMFDTVIINYFFLVNK